MKTIEAIRAELAAHKPVSRQHLYRLFKAAGIQPLGLRTRPQIYPADSAARILALLGLAPEPEELPSLEQLRGVQHAAARERARRRARRQKSQGKKGGAQ